MPILERDMPREVMLRRAKDSKCGVCGKPINAAWGQSLGFGEQYVLRCVNLEHGTIEKRRMSATEKDQLAMLRGESGMDSTGLMEMDQPTMMERIAQAKFPRDLTLDDKKMMCVVAMGYGFDPLMHEIMVYQGNPYITIDGRMRKAQETGKFDGINSRPATEAERQEREAEGGDLLYRCEAWRKGSSHPFVGWGKVRAKEIQKARDSRGAEFLPLAVDPHRIAEKRSEAQGLRKGFSIPAPFGSWEESEEERAGDVTGEYHEVKDAELPPAPPADPVTGEITPEELPFTEPPAGDIGETEEPKPKTRAKKATTPEVKPEDQPCSEEETQAIRNALGKAGMSWEDIKTQFNEVRGWGIKTLSDLTAYQAPLVLDWVAQKVGDKEAAEKAAAE